MTEILPAESAPAVWCINAECEEYHVPKENPFGLDPATIHCGTCFELVELADESEAT